MASLVGLTQHSLSSFLVLAPTGPHPILFPCGRFEAMAPFTVCLPCSQPSKAHCSGHMGSYLASEDIKQNSALGPLQWLVISQQCCSPKAYGFSCHLPGSLSPYKNVSYLLSRTADVCSSTLPHLSLCHFSEHPSPSTHLGGDFSGYLQTVSIPRSLQHLPETRVSGSGHYLECPVYSRRLLLAV